MWICIRVGILPGSDWFCPAHRVKLGLSRFNRALPGKTAYNIDKLFGFSSWIDCGALKALSSNYFVSSLVPVATVN